jgi:hypothetical protein
VVIRHVRHFLLTQSPKLELFPGPQKVITRFHQFRADLPVSCVATHLDRADLSFQDLLRFISAYTTS